MHRGTGIEPSKLGLQLPSCPAVSARFPNAALALQVPRPKETKSSSPSVPRGLPDPQRIPCGPSNTRPDPPNAPLQPHPGLQLPACPAAALSAIEAAPPSPVMLHGHVTLLCPHLQLPQCSAVPLNGVIPAPTPPVILRGHVTLCYTRAYNSHHPPRPRVLSKPPKFFPNSLLKLPQNTKTKISLFIWTLKLTSLPITPSFNI